MSYAADHVREIRQAIGTSSRQATFACGGSLPVKTLLNSNETVLDQEDTSVILRPVTIRFGLPGHGDVLTLPAEADSRPLQELLRFCQPATFGRAGQDVYDETYRRATKLDNTQFCTDFSPYEVGIIDIVVQLLLPSMTTDHWGIRAELYKLNAYAGPSGHFKPHVDTPRGETHIGSLVVCLPTVFEGGNFVVRHHGKDVLFDWSSKPNSNPKIQWAAFYSDCEHEVYPVTSGHRITLTYNLYASQGSGNLAGTNNSCIDWTNIPLFKTFRNALASPDFMPDGGMLGIHLAHFYPFGAGTLCVPQAFKGVNMAIYESLTALQDIQLELVRNLDLANINENGDYEDSDEDEETGKNIGMIFEGFENGKDDLNEEISTNGDLIYHLEGRGGWKYKKGDIIWLTYQGHTLCEMSYMAYGNEATLATLYTDAAFLITIPPAHERSSCSATNPRKRKLDVDISTSRSRPADTAYFPSSPIEDVPISGDIWQ